MRLTQVTQKIARCLADDAGLQVGEFNCLLHLYLEKPCCVRKLTEMLGIGSSSTSKLLRSLDRRGWLTRELDPVDRRMERVALTEQGVEAARQILLAADCIAVMLLGKLPDDRRVPFTECINTVTQHIKTISNHK
ncbi:MAG: winged helix-turn-helix transcriptional regulator [Bacteroidetes bacterium]|nr:winged helix-turn-helix transcriptional regulator [Bacteroidota bacterium]MCW5896204.1 winged helix-turn-helix transcriptional regulator [Bacteroidota bacterium]